MAKVNLEKYTDVLIKYMTKMVKSGYDAPFETKELVTISRISRFNTHLVLKHMMDTGLITRVKEGYYKLNV